VKVNKDLVQLADTKSIMGNPNKKKKPQPQQFKKKQSK
jgi:hypothetical protein